MSKDELATLENEINAKILLCQNDISGDYDASSKKTAKLSYLGYKKEMEQAITHLRQARMWLNECFWKSYN